jgi:hypothetical protein
MTNILVCGGRDYDDWRRTDAALSQLRKSYGSYTIVSGDACGADWLARAWAKYKNVPYKGYPADWKRHGKKAGPIRNQQMLDEERPSLVIAFPGGTGTADMVRRAKKAKVGVWLID